MKTRYSKLIRTILLLLICAWVRSGFAQSILAVKRPVVGKVTEMKSFRIAEVKKEKKEFKPADWVSSYMGLSIGKMGRFTPANCFYIRQDSSSDFIKKDILKPNPMFLNVSIFLLQPKRGFGVTMAADIWLNRPGGLIWSFGPTYKFVGNDQFSLSSSLSIGFGSIGNTVDIDAMNDSIYARAATDYGLNSDAIFVGLHGIPNLNGDDRGPGAWVTTRFSSSLFTIRPSINISVQPIKKLPVHFFADMGLNIVYAKTKISGTISGKGYDDLNQLLYSKDNPHDLSFDIPSTGMIRDQNSQYVTKFPVNPSCVYFAAGIGYSMMKMGK